MMHARIMFSNFCPFYTSMSNASQWSNYTEVFKEEQNGKVTWREKAVVLDKI